MAQRQKFTLSEVVERFDISISTVKRKLGKGDFPNAAKTHQGIWQIPVEDVLAQGYKTRKTWQEKSTEAPVEAPDTRDKELLEARHRIELLETQLQAEKRLRASAESAKDDLRAALRILEAGKPSDTAVDTADLGQRTTPENRGDTSGSPRKRRWFGF